MSAKPIVVSTCASTWPLSRRRNDFHSAMPTSAITRAPARIASTKLFVCQMTVSPTYPPSR